MFQAVSVPTLIAALRVQAPCGRVAGACRSGARSSCGSADRQPGQASAWSALFVRGGGQMISRRPSPVVLSLHGLLVYRIVSVALSLSVRRLLCLPEQLSGRHGTLSRTPQARPRLFVLRRFLRRRIHLRTGQRRRSRSCATSRPRCRLTHARHLLHAYHCRRRRTGSVGEAI